MEPRISKIAYVKTESYCVYEGPDLDTAERIYEEHRRFSPILDSVTIEYQTLVSLTATSYDEGFRILSEHLHTVPGVQSFWFTGRVEREGAWRIVLQYLN